MSAFDSQSQAIGVVLALTAACGFAAKAIFAKLAYQYGIDAITLVTLRLGLLVPVLLLIRWRRWRQEPALTRQQCLWLVVLGLLGYYLSSLLDFLGLETVSASLERMVLCLYPTLTVLLSALLYRQRLSRVTVMALVLTYSGMALVLLPDLGQSHADLGGLLLVLASTITYALYLTFSPHMIQQIGARRFTELALLVSAAAMGVHFLVTRNPAVISEQPWQVWSYAVAMALISTLFPVYALSAAMLRIGAGRTAIIGSLGPILTILFSMQLLDEWLSGWQWVGVVLVVGGVSLTSRKR